MASQFLYKGSSRDLVDFQKYVKFGSSNSIKDRQDTYNTGYPLHSFQFESVYEIDTKKNRQEVESSVTVGMMNSRYYGGMSGKEWYNRKELTDDYIEYRLKQINVKFRKLTRHEIEDANRLLREHNQIKVKKNLQMSIFAYGHQKIAIDKSIIYFKKKNIGTIIWPCGTGKTILALIIAIELKAKRVLICAPSIQLLKQWKQAIDNYFPYFTSCECIHSDDTSNKTSLTQVLRNKLKSAQVLNITYNNTMNIVKYQGASSFDLKIGDEAHHLVGQEIQNKHQYVKFHKIKSDKTLFLTATPKTLETAQSNQTNVTYSMDQRSQFGGTIDEKSASWAIENKFITPYYVVDIGNTLLEIQHLMDHLKIDTDLQNAQLFLASYMALKCIVEYPINKLLIYTNTIKQATHVKKLCDKIVQSEIFDIHADSIYIEDLHSHRNDIHIQDELKKFRTKEYGIISSVQIFGEGFDEPKLDGVVFAEKMHSEIRIIQSALRPHRLNSAKPNKHAYIIIPRICNNNNSKDLDSLDNIERIILNLSKVDENVYSKIRCMTRNKNKLAITNNQQAFSEISDDALSLMKIIRSRIYLMIGGMKMKTFCKILEENNISTETDYHEKKQNLSASLNENLPEVIRSKYPDFHWRLVDPKKKCYYDRKECIQKLKELNKKYKKQLRSKNERKKRKFLHSKDSRVPDREYKSYYCKSGQDMKTT